MQEEPIISQQPGVSTVFPEEVQSVFPEEVKKEEVITAPIPKKEEYQMPPKESGVSLLIYIVTFFVIFGITVFLGWKFVIRDKIQESFFSQPTPTIEVTATPTVQIATTSAIASPSASISSQSAEILTYALPQGWQIVKDSNNFFEVGLDPATTKKSDNVQTVGIELLKIKPTPAEGYGSFMTISLQNYDGGSRHEFIYKHLGLTPAKGDVTVTDLSPDYFEKEYNLDGKSCLFLNGISISQYPSVWGMCDAGSSQAFLITSSGRDGYLETVKTIRRIK